MKIAHISMTPVAGAPWAWSESFKEAGYESLCVARSRYDNGRVMPRDEDWPPDERGIRMIQACDLLFCHQGKPYKFPWWPKDKPAIGIYHSQPKGHSDRRMEADGWPWAAIGQWEARLFPDSWPVPNLIPIEHPWYQVGEKPDHVVIAYSPSNKDFSGWEDKGYGKTVPILESLDAEVDIIYGVPLEQCLERKARAHIVVDEVVTGAYHRSSLEALALGCLVVNNCDAECARLIRQMTGGCNHPFHVTDIEGLHDYLCWLIGMGADKLERMGRANRGWLENAWNPTELIERNFKPLMDAAFANAENK